MLFHRILAMTFVLFTSTLYAQEKKLGFDFDRQIAPLLAERCLDCHSGTKPKGGLDLTSLKAARKGGKAGPAVVPGDLEESLLWQRVESDRMPPKHPLTREEKQLLQGWIQAGARWGSDPIDPFRFTTKTRAGYDWWSLQPIRRLTPPELRDKSWSANPIDAFILSRLEKAGLSPSKEANRRTLQRRLAFDLTGLPPTAEEVDAFLKDERPDAYERQVERLLASPHHGERWARHWLDVVRFGESDGFERNASRPNAWPYRDWVIRAINADMPFDQFCRLQIAGDVLAPDDPDAIRATGYLVAGVHNTVVPMNKVAQETAFQDELEDLVGNVGQTFLGLTTNCARCHDHKFDPISQKDYYRLAAALSGVRHGERELPSRGNAARIEQLSRELAALRKKQAALEEPVRQAILSERKGGKAVRDVPAPIAAWDFRTGLKDQVGEMHACVVGSAKLTPQGLKVDGKSFARTLPLALDLRAKTLEAWVKLDSLDQRGGGVITAQTSDGGVFDAIVFGEKDARQWMAGSNFFHRTQSFRGALEGDMGFVHVAITYHEDGMITAHRNGKPYGTAYRASECITLPAGKSVVAFGIRHEPIGGNKMLAGVIQKARLYDRPLSAEEIAASSEGDDLVSERDLLARMSEAGKKERETILKERDALAAELRTLNEKHKGAKMYTALSAQPGPTRFLNRGQVTDAGAVVTPGGIPSLRGVSAEFGLSAEAPEKERRRKLAEWITQRDNPLFARVIVNRLWHYHFGVGLVETPSDFGFNGGQPSHPELLDWLAAEFIESGYRLKHVHRLIVTSRTYRQASAPRKEALAKDADNRLLWRKKPLRLEAEALRDTMLATAGLLQRDIGGKGFSDYKENNNSGTTYYDPLDPVGEAFHRRSIYRFQPRSASPGLLDVFDCPDPAAASPRRNLTTTPLQALALWNGPFALRMAEAFAERIGKQEKDAGRQVTLAYQIAYQRLPTKEEAEAARQVVERHGLRPLCRALLNSNEFLTVD